MSFFPETPMPPYTEALGVLVLSIFACATRKHEGQQLAVCIAAAMGLALLLVLWRQRVHESKEVAWREFKIRYGLSDLGFLPVRPLRRLGPWVAEEAAARAAADKSNAGKHSSTPLHHSDAYAKLEALSSQLPELVREPAKLRAAVCALPPLSEAAVLLLASSPEATRRAYVLTGQLVHAYVHASEAKWPDYPAKASKSSSQGSADGETSSNESSSEDGAFPVASAKVNGNEDATREKAAVVPGALAVPFHFCASLLGLPPVLTASATDLWNWRLNRQGSGDNCTSLEAHKPEQLTIDSIALVSSMTGLATERGFHAIPTAMHASASTWLRALLSVPTLLLRHDDARLVDVLTHIAAGIDAFTAMLVKDLPKLVDPSEFYEVYRPLLNGFHQHPLGVILRLDLLNRPEVHDVKLEARGPSAGQSTLFLLLDLALGLKHAPHSNTSASSANSAVAGAGIPCGNSHEEAPPTSRMASFQREMLAYMPSEHRALALDFAEALHATGYGSAAGYLDCSPPQSSAATPSKCQSSSGGSGARSGRPPSTTRLRRAPAPFGPWASARRTAARTAYSRCCASLAAMRRAHLSVVSTYLATRGANKGTGATSYGKLLSEALANTSAAAADAESTDVEGPAGKPKRE